MQREGNMAYRIGVIVGSLRRESYNKKLAHALAALAPRDCEFDFLDIRPLPPFDQDQENSLPPAVAKFKASIQDAHALLFVTPEYNRSMPGILKNAIDWASRPYGTSVWKGKPAGIVGISPSAAGTAMAQQHLRNVLSCLDVPVLAFPEIFLQANEGFFDVNGGFSNESTKQFLQRYVDRYCQWVEQLTQSGAH